MQYDTQTRDTLLYSIFFRVQKGHLLVGGGEIVEQKSRSKSLVQQQQ